jgi:hypothetical protein
MKKQLLFVRIQFKNGTNFEGIFKSFNVTRNPLGEKIFEWVSVEKESYKSLVTLCAEEVLFIESKACFGDLWSYDDGVSGH